MKKILIVDDDQATRHVLRKVLTSAGFSASVAKDGIDGLKALKSHRYDLLLLDVWMPRMNGLELLTKLRATKARPRVVVMTSDDAPQTVLETVREKAFKYVHKPVEALALLQTVREALSAAEPPPVEVISARPEWVELVVPCTREAAERIQTVMGQLDTDLPGEMRDTIGYAFRELLLNAVEWGGRLDPKRKVRIACLNPLSKWNVALLKILTTQKQLEISQSIGAVQYLFDKRFGQIFRHQSLPICQRPRNNVVHVVLD